jgi:peroxiredoxin/mono/diheme cytochrome c family protein
MRFSPGSWILAALLVCTSFMVDTTTATAAEDGGAEAARIGKTIDGFMLKNQFGKEYSLQDFAGKDAVVVVFLGTECPLAKLYARRLAELDKSFDDARVSIVGIDSNQQDSIQEIAAFAQRNQLEFPILKDPGNAIADKFGAIRTPEVFVLNKDRVVSYWGRIDDQHGFADGVGYQRREPTRNDLEEAVNELLAGKAVSVPTTVAMGCHIGRVHQADNNSEVTYSNQIARLFQNHCVECHRKGQIGPFEMTSYADVVGWGEMIREVVDQGRMPPWHANPTHGHFANDLSLSDEQKKLIATWVENGCPEGDPAQLPEPKHCTEGWAIGKPDEVIYMRDEPVAVPAEGVIDYYHFVVDPGWKEDKWIMATEAKPSSPETVHHILVLVQPPAGERSASRGGGRRGGSIGSGSLIAAYAPGMNPLIHTDGATALHIKAGSKLVFQMHYTPNGTPQKDRSYCGFKFADPAQVKNVARSTSVSSMLFKIPPGDPDYSVAAETKFESDALLANMTPHMHTRGKAFRYEATYPDGNKEILLDVPAYDFNWQTTYYLREPKRIPKGTTLVCTAHWDNSENNLSNPDPTKAVTWGDQTFEEMMIGFYVEVYPKDQVPVRPSGGRDAQLDPKKLFQTFDANDDGKLSKEELPGRAQQLFKVVDKDGNGSVSQEELEVLLKLFRGGRSED